MQVMKMISIAIVLLAAGCSLAEINPVVDTASVSQRTELPELSLDNIAGEPLSIRSWPGQPMVINFWGSWCAPCLREIPRLKAFQSQNPSVKVIGIAVDNLEAVRDFDADAQFNYPIMVADEQAAQAAAVFGQALAVPFTVLTAASGTWLGVHTGEISDDQLITFAETLSDLEVGRVGIETARSRLVQAGIGNF
jgi:thiol-disulfide isomerase/thioredoxin